MKYIDDEAKNIKWFNKNIFYACTLFILLINIFAFLFGGSDWAPERDISEWADVLNFKNLVACFLSAFESWSGQDVPLRHLIPSSKGIISSTFLPSTSFAMP